MVNEVRNISSNDTIPNIEKHFKVVAGPGAGKTHWLINHVKKVLYTSTRLGKTRKIACITYTNTAVETLLERLGSKVNQIEVSTIHSFLYKNLVKPYCNLIPYEYRLDIEKFDGHDDVHVFKGLLYDWKIKTKQEYIKDDKKIVNALSDLAWRFDKEGNLIVQPMKPYLGKISPTLSIRKDSYLEYKKICWEKALVDHNDILFFSFVLIVNTTESRPLILRQSRPCILL